MSGRKYQWEGKTLRKSLLFVYNPMAGKEQIKNKLSDILQVFCEADFIVTLMATNRPNDAKNAVIEYGADYDYVVCSGGDGTMNEVANGLMHLDDRPVCGYIPAGTVNDFAASLRIPKVMKSAAELVVQGKVFQCDMGSFNDRFFTYIAGFGAFTEVSYTTPQEWKNMLGKTAYFVEGLKHLAEIKPHHMHVIYDEGEVEDDFILGLVSNSVSVAGYKAYEKEDIKMDDGIFEVLFIRDLKNALELQEVLNALLTKNLDAPEMFRCSSRGLHVICDDEVQWTLDGEDGGSWQEVWLKNHQQVLPIICGDEALEDISVQTLEE
jgi:YegS/Rv2252/BmrU family lipid kinase